MPTVVYIDDEPEEFASALRELSLDVRGFRDDELKAAAAEAPDADLLVLDYFYGRPDADEAELSDETGLTTFEKVRRKLRDRRPPTVLVSGHLEEALEGVRQRPHVAALQLGVESVRSKSAQDVVALASASATLRGVHKEGVDFDEWLDELCMKCLELDSSVEWYRVARRHVNGAQPPLFVEGTTWQVFARGVLAWLGQAVMPYPSFLVSDRQVAVRLGIRAEHFVKWWEGDASGEIAEKLQTTLYTGPLSDGSRRWWRAGCDMIAWEYAQRSDSPATQISKDMGLDDDAVLPFEEPVVVFNADLEETEDAAEAVECVRARDEHFPPDAAPAWVRIEDARFDRLLREKVVVDDRSELEQ